MKRAILLAAAAVLALSGIYAKAPVVINNDDYIVCSQQKIKKLNRKICRKFRRTYWKEQISHDSIYIYHFFSIYIGNSARQALSSMIGNCYPQIISPYTDYTPATHTTETST